MQAPQPGTQPPGNRGTVGSVPITYLKPTCEHHWRVCDLGFGGHTQQYSGPTPNCVQETISNAKDQIQVTYMKGKYHSSILSISLSLNETSKTEDALAPEGNSWVQFLHWEGLSTIGMMLALHIANLGSISSTQRVLPSTTRRDL